MNNWLWIRSVSQWPWPWIRTVSLSDCQTVAVNHNSEDVGQGRQ